MSRTGKKPIPIPSGVEVKVENRVVSVKGPKGSMSCDLPPKTGASVENSSIVVVQEIEDKESGAFHGLARSLLANMVEGVTKGFEKELEIQGVGFRAEVKGQSCSLFMGFASSVDLSIPDGVEVKVADNTKITVAGCDKQKVGDMAARIRKVFPVEPYKGKGIRYKDEHVRRKAGKTVA